MKITAIFEKSETVKKGAPGIEKVGYMFDKKVPKPEKKVPRLKKSVYGVDGGSADGAGGE